MPAVGSRPAVRPVTAVPPREAGPARGATEERWHSRIGQRVRGTVELEAPPGPSRCPPQGLGRCRKRRQDPSVFLSLRHGRARHGCPKRARAAKSGKPRPPSRSLPRAAAACAAAAALVEGCLGARLCGRGTGRRLKHWRGRRGQKAQRRLYQRVLAHGMMWQSIVCAGALGCC